MSLRNRATLVALVLLGVSVAGATVIVAKLRDITTNQRIIVFKDRMYHEHERARTSACDVPPLDL